MANEMNNETIYAMLREIKEVAMQSSLTGGLKKGSRILIDVYNRCLATITEEDEQAAKLFSPLATEPDAVHIDEIGVAAALLSRYVNPNKHPHLPHSPIRPDHELF
ncbi:hypothetical protein JOD43_003863 [Pullulanibacillus pueri]|uniref:Uncharacterized protein n=1 Tax=Pullulanibacillus pueri TaxID=1437324 RepID=A0A8J2ZYN5_9BACL|nr:hypothetical protein [Pullulanibacillus pueri]MBM7683683.1 hypothetical protein [Pullulanibacillus pueri]GGH87126.1 hypothetical protein GCM10007096_36420 [Pullulanibacillus pueri]